MKTKQVVGGALVLALAGASTIAVAQGQRAPGAYLESLFERYDADGDERITREEFESAVPTRFARDDANGDGNLSAEEMLAAWKARNTEEQVMARIERMIERADENGDGVLSAGEMPDKRRGKGRLFDRADANGDGVITMAEAQDVAARWARRGKRAN